jgi:hypothetical protein
VKLVKGRRLGLSHVMYNMESVKLSHYNYETAILIIAGLVDKLAPVGRS